MKVLAAGKNNTFICEVTQSEVEKFMNLYYGNMKRLEAGQEIDLGAGHNFEYETRKALESTKALIKDNADVIKAITNGISIINFSREDNSSK